MSKQPTIDDFRIKNVNTVPPSASYERKRENILALHAKGYTVTECARKTYPSTIPEPTARLISPEGDATIDSRLMAKWNNYVAFVRQVIHEQGKA